MFYVTPSKRSGAAAGTQRRTQMEETRDEQKKEREKHEEFVVSCVWWSSEECEKSRMTFIIRRAAKKNDCQSVPSSSPHRARSLEGKFSNILKNEEIKGKSTKEKRQFGIARAMRSSFVIRRESCPSLGRINFGIALLVLR